MTEERRIDQAWPIIYAHMSRGSGSVGAFKHFRYAAIAAAAIIMIPDGENDVTGHVTGVYSVLESAGGTSGGTFAMVPGGTVTLYTDGVDTLTVDCTAGGELHCHRTAGAATFTLSAWLVWL